MAGVLVSSLALIIITTVLILPFSGTSRVSDHHHRLHAVDRWTTTTGAELRYACAEKEEKRLPFCDRSLPAESRARDLVSRLSLEEKISLLVDGAANVSRLGLPSYEWWSEALHGLADNGPGVRFAPDIVPHVTTFPQVILSAASFNRTLWHLIAQAVSTEARAMYNVGLAGLTYWSPNLNIFRDPRWGRGQETPGEDPLLSSEYAIAYVRGLQGQFYLGEVHEEVAGSRENSRFSNARLPLKVSACCKHFTAYDLEAWGNSTRYTFNAMVSQQDLVDTFQPPFKSCVQDGEATCIMCSYNRINGIPACADGSLLKQVAREEWGFKGYITSDCDAVAVVYEYVGYASSPEEAVADCLNAGLDLNCGTYVSRHAAAAIENGSLNVSTVDQALINLFNVQMQLGLFNGDPKAQPFGSIGLESICSVNHRQLALEAARQGLVLLKNENMTLPLSKDGITKLAVVGPNANASNDSLLGDYAGPPCSITTPLQGLQMYSNIMFEPGCVDIACTSDSLFQSAVDIVSTADATILFAGLDQSQEREEYDRTELVLPGNQQNLIAKVSNAAKGPVVLVILSGGPVDILFARDDAKIQGIIWAGYPGESGGQAIAEVIFGDYNPGGRLPVTWYPANFTSVPMTDMNMRPNLARSYPGRTYRFYEGETVFKFGFGLTYTEFTHSIVSAPSEIYLPFSLSELHDESPVMCDVPEDKAFGKALNLTIRISNVGSRSGSHTVLVYSKLLSKYDGAPKQQLVGFRKVHLEAQQSCNVTLPLDPFQHLSVVDKDGRKLLKPGPHALLLNDLDEQHIVYVKIYGGSGSVSI